MDVDGGSLSAPAASGAAQRTCQSCKTDFNIAPEDFDFYKKMEVPPPTFCPDCRMQRRFAWRNERKLFRNTCAATGKSLISSFSPESGITVYDRDYWWSDAWDPMAFGAEYDLKKPFFVQFQELLKRAPMPSVFNARTTNCEYCSYTGEFKNGYLVSASWNGENTSYASRCLNIKDSADLFCVYRSDLCYEDVTSEKLYNTAFSFDSENCTDCNFIYDCRGCTNCFGCTGLRNKSYYIWNQPYSKEEYLLKIKEMDLGSHRNLVEVKKRFHGLKLAAIRKYANVLNSPNSTGDNIFNIANCKECFMVTDNIKNCKFLVNAVGPLEDSYDGYGIGAQADLVYEVFDSGVQGSRLLFCASVYGGRDVRYSINCHGSQDLFGCIGLRAKQYCILNKQYSKEEYEALLPKILQHMKDMPYAGKNGRIYGYGEFFPAEMSPFAYNETIAQEYFPLNEKSAADSGFSWRSPVAATHKPTMKTEDLPDNIGEVADAILTEVIQCADCGAPYRIIKMELDLLHKMNIALPRQCPECRHRARFEQVNPSKLVHRSCGCGGTVSGDGKYTNSTAHFHGSGKCSNEFETTYAIDRLETVYCEQCYNSEIV